MSHGYADQYERVKRYFSRFKSINDGKPHDSPSQYYDDDVYAFFQNCYHFKDWIKNDPACSTWSDVEAFVTANPDLSICADLCNGIKHLTLTRSRSGQHPSFSGGIINVVMTDTFGPNASVSISVKYNVAAASGDVDAFSLAERSMKAWQSFLASNGVTHKLPQATCEDARA